MTDLYFEDYEPRAKEKRGESCFGSAIILCLVIVGFLFFFWLYTFFWEYMIAPLADHGLELVILAVIMATILVVYVVRNKALEKRKIMAAS